MKKTNVTVAIGKFKIKATHSTDGEGYDVEHSFQLDGDTETIATGLAATVAGFMRDSILEDHYEGFLDVFKTDILEYLSKSNN